VDRTSPAAASSPPAPAAAAPLAAAAGEARAKAQAETPPQPTLEAERDVASLEKRAQPAASANALSAADAVAGAPPATPPTAPPASAANASLRRESAPSRLSTLTNPVDSLIVSSNPATRLRLLPGGNVQRSADGGATWRTETTGATVTLTAGSSPSPSVCWLVGPNGLVLLSTNGPSWRRLTFPEAVDLRSVVAVDGENATVITADGRAFTTTNGGQTWLGVPGI
jgi:photosystem II stability/assembly factor-like uncharacterized protein